MQVSFCHWATCAAEAMQVCFFILVSFGGKKGLLVGVCGPACCSGPTAASRCAGVGGEVPSWAAFVFPVPQVWLLCW